ncbi:MAG: hypothetical protein SNJ70_09740, partial [Armatimonadota bacterium]
MSKNWNLSLKNIFSKYGFFLLVIVYILLWHLIPKLTFLANIISKLPSEKLYGIILIKSLMAIPVVMFMLSQFGIVYFFSKMKLNWWKCILIIFSGLIFIVAIVQIIIYQLDIVSKIHRYPNIREQLFILGHYYGFLRLPISIFIIIIASGIGYLVSLRIKDKNLILPVAMFAAYIDYWTVTRGPVSKAI